MNFLAGLLEKIVGSWLVDIGNAVKNWIVRIGTSWFRGNQHKKNVDKYVDAINDLTAQAKLEIGKFGRVTPETEAKLAQMLERRNRGIDFNDDWLQNNSGN